MEQPQQPLMKFSTRSVRRGPSPSQLPRKGDSSIMPNYARQVTAQSESAALTEDDSLILETEDLMQRIQEATQNDEPINPLVADLSKIWSQESQPFDSSSGEIGPATTAKPVEKAVYISSLILTLHHSRLPKAKALLDWLDQNHFTYTQYARQVMSTTPNVTSSEVFWDTVLGLVLRGKLNDVVKLLGEADFKYAATAEDEGAYDGVQLQEIQSAVYKARQILNQCPFNQNDFEVTSESWQVYRAHLEDELVSLSQSAVQEQEFQADNFNLKRSQPNLFPKKTRKLPQSIYHTLRMLYSILLGSAPEVISQSQDWLEATISLTVWWDGSSSIDEWRMSVSQAQQDPAHDVYSSRLRDSFLCVTDPSYKTTFAINSLSPMEVAVGCILQTDIASTLNILSCLSQPIASSIAEIASLSDYLTPSSDSQLSANDLMVLSFGGASSTLTKDEILQSYATALFYHAPIQLSCSEQIEGWELSLTILRRLDEEAVIHELVTELLDQLPLENNSRAEKAINLCTDLGLVQEARTLSERFGDYLLGSTSDYGLALLCYARALKPRKIQSVTDTLISYSLVQSRAYPPEHIIDGGLKSLVESPRDAFAEIADVDPGAAADLQFYMVGYACIRRFYTCRDSKAKKQVAARALVAAINSAADSIYGGLYDPERQTAIQVDCLLTLLGEATAFFENGKTVLSAAQMYDILAAIEDTETVSDRVYAPAESCLEACMRSYAGSQPPSPHAMLKKSMSSGKDSNFSFSMMGSEMLAGSKDTLGARTESSGSGLLIENGNGENVKREWDWRERFATEKGDVGRRVLCVLRREIASGLAGKELEAT